MLVKNIIIECSQLKPISNFTVNSRVQDSLGGIAYFFHALNGSPEYRGSEASSSFAPHSPFQSHIREHAIRNTKTKNEPLNEATVYSLPQFIYILSFVFSLLDIFSNSHIIFLDQSCHHLLCSTIATIIDPRAAALSFSLTNPHQTWLATTVMIGNTIDTIHLWLRQ